MDSDDCTWNLGESRGIQVISDGIQVDVGGSGRV